MPARGQPGNSGDFWSDFLWGFNQVMTPGTKIGKMIGLKKGGKIKRTGKYRLHKGERVLNSKQTKAWEKAHKKKRKRRRKK